MIYKGDRSIPTQFYTDIPTEKNINTNLDNYFKQGFITSLGPNHTHLSQIIHAPYSRPHIVRVLDDKSTEISQLFNKEGLPIKTIDSLQPVGIPKTMIIENQTLRDIISENCKKTGVEIDLNTVPNHIYGDYQPVQIFKNMNIEGMGINVHLFFLAFLSTIAKERKDLNIKGNTNIVIHTDIPYFISQGDQTQIPPTIRYIDALAKLFGVNIFIENNEKSKNQVFQEVIPWGLNPEDIYTLTKPYPNMGVCIDLKHCINNGLSIPEILSKIQSINSQKGKLLIHSRHDYIGDTKFNELINYIYREAIPIAYE